MEIRKSVDQRFPGGAMPTAAVGMWRLSGLLNMPTLVVGMAPVSRAFGNKTM